MLDILLPFVQGIIWTLICLADDDPLCQAAARTAGALQLLVPVMGLISFSPNIDAFMGLSALAARALRLLGDSSSSSTADQLSCQSPLSQPPVNPHPLSQFSPLGSEEEEDWTLAAVPFLATMLDTSGKGHSKQPLMRSLSTSSQKLSTHLFILLRFHTHTGCIPPSAASPSFASFKGCKPQHLLCPCLHRTLAHTVPESCLTKLLNKGIVEQLQASVSACYVPQSSPQAPKVALGDLKIWLNCFRNYERPTGACLGRLGICTSSAGCLWPCRSFSDHPIG